MILKRTFFLIFSCFVVLSTVSCGNFADIETSYFAEFNSDSSLSTYDTSETSVSTRDTTETSVSTRDTTETSVSTHDTVGSSLSTYDTSESSVSVSTNESQETSASEKTEDSGTKEESVSSETSQTEEVMVWITGTGTKYHEKENCSNMKNPSQISLTRAKNSGYTPCKKCYGK